MEECDFNPKKRRKVEILDVILGLILIGLGIWALLNYNYIKTQATTQILFYGYTGLFIATFFLELIPQLLNPYLVELVAIGVGLNVNMVIITAIGGTIMGSVIGFEIGKKYGFDLICPLFRKKTLEKIINFWQRKGKWVVLIGALTPFPYIPLVFGALELKRKDFFLWGLIPRIIGFIIVGYGFYWGFF